MNEELRSLLAQMEPLPLKLKASPKETFATRTKIPDRGVYVFYEGEKALYVGRSNQIWERIRTHGRNGATHNQATFAFRLLAKEYSLDIGHSAPANRSQIAEEYAAEFREQKQRVRSMMIRAVAITDDTASYFFEAYAILALGTTGFNKFEPHQACKCGVPSPTFSARPSSDNRP